MDSLGWNGEKSSMEICFDVASVSHEVKRKGWSLVSDVILPADCERQIRIAEQLYKAYPALWEGTDADSFQRFWGYESVSTWANESVINSPNVRDLFADLSRGASLETTLMLERRISGARGEAGPWHVDSFFDQFKIFIYFSDVGSHSPRFQFYERTNTLQFKLKTLIAMGLKARKDHYIYQKPDVLAALLANRHRLVSPTLRKGSMLVVNTSLIHRVSEHSGSPRTVLTYYAYKNKMPPHVDALVSGKRNLYKSLGLSR